MTDVLVRFHGHGSSFEEEILSERVERDGMPYVIYRYHQNRTTGGDGIRRFRGGYRRRGDSNDYDYDPSINDPEGTG